MDPSALGSRLRSARVARGWTQSELAGEGISTGYVSRIESGARRPTLQVLRELAQRLETPVDELLRGVSATELDEIRLGLDYAELALESGEATDAESQAREALTRAELASIPEYVARGHYLLGRAREVSGHLNDAIAEFEEVLVGGSGLLLIHAGIALSRCHREAGDLALAIEAGERVQSALSALGLDQTDEAVQLAVTVAGAYAMRGDLGHATRLCADAVAEAEALDSPRARSAAYWNASVFQSLRGETRAAVPLAARALALLGEGNDTRNLARLRLELGRLLLKSDPPEIAQALDHVTQARQQLTETSAGAADVAASEVTLAQAHLLSGDAEQAAEIAARVESTMAGEATLFRVEAMVIRGQAAGVLGHVTEAEQVCQDAATLLSGMDAGQRAAQLWFDLAELLEQIGEFDAARRAFRQAATASGLAPRVHRVAQGADA